MRKSVKQFLSKYFKQHRLIPIGYVTPVCPHCMRSLKKKPSRKKKCPYCNKIIYVRTRPLDRQKVLVTESQISIIDEQWSIARGTHNEYLEKQREFEAERAKLAIKFGCEPTENDIRWSLLNKRLIDHVNNGDWGLYRNTKLAMAEILRKETKWKTALSTYLEVCYLDLNGPNNSGIPFSINEAFLYEGVLDPISKLVNQMKLNQNDVQSLFKEVSKTNYRNLKLPVSPTQAWKQIERKLFDRPLSSGTTILDPAEQLKKLKDLYDSGILTEEEYKDKRVKLVEKL